MELSVKMEGIDQYRIAECISKDWIEKGIMNKISDDISNRSIRNSRPPIELEGSNIIIPPNNINANPKIIILSPFIAIIYKRYLNKYIAYATQHAQLQFWSSHWRKFSTSQCKKKK